jgi:5-methylcytosine-specific restriction endonuclease McrA
MAAAKQPRRADHSGQYRTAYEKARKAILATQDTCAWCGKPVDKSLRYPDPMAPTVDHIIPISKGGHPSDVNNLQLMHFACNVAKGQQILKEKNAGQNAEEIGNDDLPQSMDWSKYRPGKY